MISPPFAPFSAPNIVVRRPSPSQLSSSISYALFDCCFFICCSLAPRTLVMDARAVHRRAPPPHPLPSSLSHRRVIVASRVFPPYHLPPPPPPLHAMTLSPRCCWFIVASRRRRLSRVALLPLPPAFFPVTPHLPCLTHHCLSRPPVSSSSFDCCIAWELFLMSFGFSFSLLNLVKRKLPGVVGVNGGDVRTAIRTRRRVRCAHPRAHPFLTCSRGFNLNVDQGFVCRLTRYC